MSEFRFAALLGALERAVVEALHLTPLVLAPELERMEGSWKDGPVILEARAYSSPRVRYARFVTVSGDTVDIANLLVLPRPGDSLPLFGADLVALGRDTALVVADLSPSTGDPDAADAQRAALAGHTAGLDDVPGRCEPPEWCDAWFSRDALCARIAIAARDLVEARLLAMCGALIELTRAAGVRTSSADLERDAGLAAEEIARQRAYCTSHVTDDRALQMLGRMFEPQLASRFLREVLFPVEGHL